MYLWILAILTSVNRHDSEQKDSFACQHFISPWYWMNLLSMITWRLLLHTANIKGIPPQLWRSLLSEWLLQWIFLLLFMIWGTNCQKPPFSPSTSIYFHSTMMIMTHQMIQIQTLSSLIGVSQRRMSITMVWDYYMYNFMRMLVTCTINVLETSITMTLTVVKGDNRW